MCATVLPGSALAGTSSTPTMNQLLAKANALSQQIDSLSQQYDNLKIQLGQAKAEAALARQGAKRDAALLKSDQSYVDNIAVEGYMTGGLSPSLQMLQAAQPQTMLNRASIMTQLQRENGAKINLVASAEVAAQRAIAAANQEEQRANHLKSSMAETVAKIQSRENTLNSRAYTEATAIFQQTGKYPITHVPGDSLGVAALNEALSMRGRPYVWGGASPSVGFDCSGLVVWAYAQEGVHLEHFTGDLWNEVVHVPMSELKPGGLVFFYADIGHVGIYIGNGLMVDAPTFGQPVQVQPISEDPLVGEGNVP